MNCPTCGNNPRHRLPFFVYLSMFRFRCPVCGAPLRGNPFMVVLDIACLVAFAFLLVYFRPYFKVLQYYFGVLGIFMFVGAAYVAARLPIVLIQLRFGRYRRISTDAPTY